MAKHGFPVVDCDGHIIEASPEMLDFMPEPFKSSIRGGRNVDRLFPGLDGMHMPQARQSGAAGRERVNASEHRMGSGEDWVAFLERADIEKAVMFTTGGLAVGIIQNPDYAIAVCQGFNDYVHAKYRRMSDRLHPMALIPMQNVPEAVKELPPRGGGPWPAGGDVAHARAAGEPRPRDVLARLRGGPTPRCVLALHGGSNLNLGMEGFTDNGASHILHHPLPLIINFVSFSRQGALDRFPNLKLGFMEGGAGCWRSCWTVWHARTSTGRATQASTSRSGSGAGAY